MKIRSADCHIIPAGERSWVVVAIRTEGGLVGYGEGTLFFPLDQAKAVKAIFDDCRQFLIGSDAGQIEFLWQKIYDRYVWRGGPIEMTALGAIDTALWDIAGKAVGRPVYQLLGGRVRDSVRIYHNGWARHETNTEALVEDARKAVAAGANALKWYPLKVGAVGGSVGIIPGGVRKGIDQVAAVRKAVGPEVTLMVDVWRQLDVASAIAFCRAVEEFDLLFIEEPVTAENPELIKKVASQTGARLATGERLLNKWEFRPIIESQAVGVIQPDIPRVGGLTEARKIVALAETYGLYVAPHNPAGNIVTALSVQLAAVSSSFLILERFLRPGNDAAKAIHLAYEERGDQIVLGQQPGIGIEVDEAYLERAGRK